jgi:glucose/arabinose dehydrogenase
MRITGQLWVFPLALISTTELRSQSIPPLEAVRVASGQSQALFVTAPPGDYNRLFIVRQTGQIDILNLETGTVNATPFLDIHTSIRSGGEQGLLGMAFDPDYAVNGKFYLDFTVNGGVWGQGTTHISQFQVSANSDVADSTEHLLTMAQPSPSPAIPLTFDHPQANHNGGWIGFSPRSGDDHNLYIATGDGGNGNDQDPSPAPSPPGHIEPGGNSQNKTTLLGKMLRVHVDPATATYSIPASNPFTGLTGARPEIWAYGLRNPFRDSFDRLIGRMFIADVGEDTREEVDVQEAANPGGGENYEWRLREGIIATPTGSPPVGGDRPPDGVDPIMDYGRSVGGTVIGGYVYRGRQIPDLRGTYVFGDYLARKIFILNYDGTTVSNFQEITSQLFPTASGNITLNSLSSFGEDANGELYIADLNGNVFGIVPVTPNVVIDSVMKMPDGFLLHGFGVPFKTHTIQAVDDITQPFTAATVIGTAVAAGDGSFQFLDSSVSNVGTRFYRVTYPDSALGNRDNRGPAAYGSMHRTR